jgi:hypothetical protein
MHHIYHQHIHHIHGYYFIQRGVLTFCETNPKMGQILYKTIEKNWDLNSLIVADWLEWVREL